MVSLLIVKIIKNNYNEIVYILFHISKFINYDRIIINIFYISYNLAHIYLVISAIYVNYIPPSIDTLPDLVLLK